MTTSVSTKTELVEWLKQNNLFEGLDEKTIPEVKPARVSKWVDYHREPDWIFDDVFVSLDPTDKEALGGRAKIGLDLKEQNNTVKVYFVRTNSFRHGFYTRISKFGTIHLPKEKVDACNSMKELAELVNAVWDQKVLLEDPLENPS